MSSDKSAAERVAAMRKCYANSPEPLDHLSDLELALREMDAAVKNECRVQSNYDRLLQEQNRWQRDVRTGAQRAARESEKAWAKQHFDILLRQHTQPITALAYQAEQVGPKVGTAQLHTLHMFARDVADLLKQSTQSDEMKVAEHWRTEAWRLRDYITTAGRALHAETVTEHPEGGCHCRGCELIRGMDDVADMEPQSEVESCDD